MANPTVKFTYQDLLTAPDDGTRYEIFEGELIVTPSPNLKHQKAVRNLTLIIGNYVDKHSLGDLFTDLLDVYFDEETVLDPIYALFPKHNHIFLKNNSSTGYPI